MCNALGVNPWIEVDGGVTPENAWKVIEVGANAIVSGSGVYGAKDYAAGETAVHFLLLAAAAAAGAGMFAPAGWAARQSAF